MFRHSCPMDVLEEHRNILIRLAMAQAEGEKHKGEDGDISEESIKVEDEEEEEEEEGDDPVDLTVKGMVHFTQDMTSDDDFWPPE